MEAVQTKPRVSYTAFQKSLPKGNTVADLIGRYMIDMEKVRPVGTSQRYSMEAMQRDPLIGPKVASAATRNEFIAFFRSRAEKVCPATVNHSASELAVVYKHASASWEDCEDLADTALIAAKRYCHKRGIIGKSVPRDRRPTPEELAKLLNYFNTPAKRGKARTIDMATLTVWQAASGRRISETCRARWEDWNREDHTLMVYGMKDPRTRKKNKVVALTDEAQAILEVLWDVRTDEPRIFPYRSRSVSAAYTKAKRETSIDGLRLHDSRRECASRLVEKGFSSAEAILFTGHDSTAIFERVYMRLKPADARHGPIALRKAA